MPHLVTRRDARSYAVTATLARQDREKALHEARKAKLKSSLSKQRHFGEVGGSWPVQRKPAENRWP